MNESQEWVHPRRKNHTPQRGPPRAHKEGFIPRRSPLLVGPYRPLTLTKREQAHLGARGRTYLFTLSCFVQKYTGRKGLVYLARKLSKMREGREA